MRTGLIFMMSCIFFVSLLSSHVAADDGKSVAAVLLIDSSGSMKKTDPANLRKAAARLFISLLRDNDRVGLVSFSDEGQKLSDLTEVGDKQKRTGLIKSLEKITSDGKYTNIYDGIQKGYELLKPSSNKERLLILMSDGQMDLGDKAREDSLTKEILERVKISVNIKTPDGRDTALVLHDDGTNGDSAPGDGVYTLELPVEQLGEHNLIEVSCMLKIRLAGNSEKWQEELKKIRGRERT